MADAPATSRQRQAILNIWSLLARAGHADWGLHVRMLRGRLDEGDCYNQRIDLIEVKTRREPILVRHLPAKPPFDPDQ